MRRSFVWLHCCVGLAMAVFFIIEGLTGGLPAFRGDLARLFDPELAGAPPSPGAKPLDLATLIERAESQEPKARMRWLQPLADDTAVFRMDPRADPETGKPDALEPDTGAYDVVMRALFGPPPPDLPQPSTREGRQSSIGGMRSRAARS